MVLVRFFFAFVLAALVSVASALAVFAVRWARDIPDYRALDTLTLGSVTKVYARDRTLIATLSPKLPGGGRVNRTLVTLDDISPYLVSAIVTSEDRRFFEHFGVDPIGLGRALSKALAGERVEGGSTLTNQITRNTLLRDLYDPSSRDVRDVQRKVKEWILSLQVERSFTKEEILQTYLNVIYWGDGGATEIRGIYGAAKAYFNKLPKDLTLAESAYLTVLVPNSGRYFDFKAYRPLMFNVIDRMVEDGWVTIAESRAAKLERIQPNGWQVTYDAKGNVTSAKLVDKNAKNLRAVTTERAPFFVQQVERELLEKFGREQVYGAGGLTVYTTLDLQAQDSIETASRDSRMPVPAATMAAVLLEPQTGQVLALVGQKLRDGETPLEWNNAAQGQRQVGSSIKPLLYTTGLERGFAPDHTEYDAPTTFQCTGCPTKGYTPQNFGQIYSYRNMPLRESLDKSLNIPTVKLAQAIGLKNFQDKLKQLELPVQDNVGLSLAIGTLETTPLKMAAAYAPFVNGGLYNRPSFLTYVENVGGKVLFDYNRDLPRPKRVWSPQVAYAGFDYLYGVVNDLSEQQGGLSFRALIPGWQVGGKTGTTNEVKDLWFMGVTPKAVGAVWMGIQQGGAMPSNIYSGEYPPPVWRQMMSGYLRGKPPLRLEPPDGVDYRFVNVQPKGPVRAAFVTRSYNVAKPLPPAIDDLPTYQEVQDYPRESGTVVIAIDARTGLLANEFTPASSVKIRRVLPTLLPEFEPYGSSGQ